MTTAATIAPLIGSAPIGNWFIPDTTQHHPLGTIVQANDPYYGGQELIYLQMPTSTAYKVGHIVTWGATAATPFLASAVANTANLGRVLGFMLNAVASSTSTQYAWAVIGGTCPVYSDASVAADTALGITAAGQAGAIANGKQILNARVVVAATGTVAKTGLTRNGSKVITFGNVDGFFVGQALTGTGVGSSALISAIDPDNRTVTASVVSTATGSVTVTATNNDSTSYWNTVVCNRPFAQGQVS